MMVSVVGRNWSWLQSRRWREERAGAALCHFVRADTPTSQSFGRNLTAFSPPSHSQPNAFLTEQKSRLLPSSTAAALILGLRWWIKSRALRNLIQGTVKILFESNPCAAHSCHGCEIVLFLFFFF